MRTQILTLVASDRYCDFPMDMLRYDQCWPYSEEDSHKIRKTFNWDRHDPQIETILVKRRVENKKDLPTVRRWESRGWKVLHINVI